MKRSEAYHILGKMWDDATPEQAEALSIAQNDIEFVDLIPKDMVAVVRCKDCKHSYKGSPHGLMCECPVGGQNTSLLGDNDFCSCGERRADDAD